MTDPLFQAAVLGVVEGVTEFIPVSSTGHLILVGSWIGFEGEKAKTFEIVIQLGAILAIVWLYRTKFLDVARGFPREPASRRFLTNLLIGFVPIAVVGLLLGSWVKAHLFAPAVVAWALLVGGLAMLAIEAWRPVARLEDAADLPPGTALSIGLAQLLALVPGISRSGATIMGGYALGLSRLAATEFSFYLAVPVLAAASGYDLLRNLNLLVSSDIPVFAVGFVVSFLSALVVVKATLRFLTAHTFTAFAWYRIGLGLLLLGLGHRLPPAS
jgi:undecaprenyl-diphosphatase